MAVKKGQVFGLYIDEDGDDTFTKVALAQSKELTQSKEALDKSNDDNAEHASYVGGLKSGELTVEAFYDYGGSSNGYELMQTAYAVDTSTPFQLRGAETGDVQYEFDAHVTELTLTSNTNELVTFSATLQIDGALTTSTVATGV